MALIACPECSHQVSERATACPQCGCPIARSTGGDVTPDASGRRRLTTRQKFGVIFFALMAFGAVWVIGSYVTNPEPADLSAFGATSGTIDLIIRLLFGIGIPFFIGMGLWHDPKAKPPDDTAGTEWVMLVGGPHTGDLIEVERGAPTAVHGGDLYRRNDSDLFLHIG